MIGNRRMFEYFPGNYRWSINVLMALNSGAHIGDVELAGAKLRACVGDDEAWHREWADLASVMTRRASNGLVSPLSAGESFLGACLYHLMSERFLEPNDGRRKASYREALDMFELGRKMADPTVERVEVLYERTSLPAYFIPAQSTPGDSSLASTALGASSTQNDNGKRPAVIFVCGLDTTKELSYLRVRHELARRGLHCLAIDTPGVGEALRLRQLYTRYDYEVPIAAAVDYLEGRSDVDGARIGIVGSSLGGYYVARAAAFEPRIRACVAWRGQFDYHAVWQKRLAEGGALGVPFFQLMYVTGKDTPAAALEHIQHFRLEDFAERVTCPFLLLHGSEDQQISLADAQRAFALIASAHKDLKVFSGEDGGSQHCQNDNAQPALYYLADWLARTLSS